MQWNPQGATPQEEVQRRARAASKAAEGTALKDAPEGLLSSIASLSMHSSPAHAMEECGSAKPASVSRPLAGSSSTTKTAPAAGLSSPQTSGLLSRGSGKSHQPNAGVHAVAAVANRSEVSTLARDGCWRPPPVRQNPSVTLSVRGEGAPGPRSEVEDSGHEISRGSNRASSVVGGRDKSLTDEVLLQRTSVAFMSPNCGDGCWKDTKLEFGKSRQSLRCSDSSVPSRQGAVSTSWQRMQGAREAETAMPRPSRGMHVRNTDLHEEGRSMAACETHGNLLSRGRHGHTEQPDCLPMEVVPPPPKLVLIEEIS